ncbi:MAG: RNA polymerase sigma-70 factor [Bacteroidales bacterium]|nr:RNA polymerase sigma-70 factor [Bacteroidales bacterium]
MSNITHLISDKNKFEQIFKEYYSELCGFANKFMLDIYDAEEIVQDVFVSIWNNKETIDINVSLKSYLYSSVKNSCLNKKKHIKIREKYKEHNEREMEQSSVNTDDEYNATELDIKIRSVIENMPIQRRKIFVMSRYEGLKYKEIAEALNISIKTVENQMGSALKFLRKELIDYIVILFLFFLKL